MGSAGPKGGVYSMFGSAAANLAEEQQAGPSSATFDWDIEERVNKLDLVFVSKGMATHASYTISAHIYSPFEDHGRHRLHGNLSSATKNIESICDNIIQSEQLSAAGALRIGLIAYRDHPPQDHTYLTRNFGFETDVQVVKKNLNSLYATGGGDPPEAVTAALSEALTLNWRNEATKLAVLIADAPPHGIGEYGDGFPNGSPDGHDPLLLARQMAAQGISLFMVACEPALSGYHQAVDFFQALVKLTGGLLVPLTTASLLSHVIIAAVGEAMDLERLQREVGDAVAERLRNMSLENQQQGTLDMDGVARELHEKLLLRNENTKQLHIESIYKESEESQHNIEVWSSAPNIAAAKPFIKKVIGSRLSDKYLATRHAASTFKPFTPFAHPRTFGSSSPSPSSTGYRATSISTPHLSPSRKVISDFSAFRAEPGMSVSGSPRGSSSTGESGGGGTATTVFGSSPSRSTYTPAGGASNFRERLAMRGMDDEDEDENEEENGDVAHSSTLPVAVGQDGVLEVAGEDGQMLKYRQGAISLDQARRLAVQSAFRGGLG